MKVLFDSSILIDHLRKVEGAEKLVIKISEKELIGYISVITEAELLSGKECKKSSKKSAVENLIKLFMQIDVNKQIAQKAGEFRRNYDVPLDDCIIAATAFHQKCKIWTKNKKDFQKIKEIEVEEPY